MKKRTNKKVKFRKHYRRSPFERRIFLGIAVLLFLVGLILTGKLISAISSLSQPLSPDTPFMSAKHFSWDGKRTFNLVIKDKHVYVLSLNPEEKSVVVMKVPDETYTTLPYSFGRWPFRSVYDLGQSGKTPIGAILLRETISMTFGVPADGYMIVSEKLASTPFEEVIEEVRKNPFAGLKLVRESKTDLSSLEFLKFWWGVRGVRSDKFKIIDLEQSPITQSDLLQDGSRALIVDQAKLDQFVQNQLEDSEINKEGLNIGIFNSTKIPGLAEKASRIVTNLGGRVVFTANLNEKAAKSMVLGKASVSKNRLAEIFAPDCVENKGFLNIFGRKDSGKCNFESLSFDPQRADINIILGEDYATRYDQTSKNP